MKKDKKDKKEKKEKKSLSPAKQTERPVEKEKEKAPEPAYTPSKDPLAYAVSIVGGKWKLRILWALADQTGRRYGDLKHAIPEITDMMLSQSLRELTAEGLIARTQYQEIPPRVEYSITASGVSLLPALSALREWSVQRMKLLKL